jgi:U3 small nucleolar RNA-associated protein 15
MAAKPEPLQGVSLPPRLSTLTPEERYWKSFSTQVLLPSQQSSPITHISFPSAASTTNAAPNAVEHFAVTSGTRVQIFSSRTRKVVKTISRFNIEDIAHSGNIRRDGRILVAGGDSGAIQAFDIGSRAILKTWKEHKQPVWVAQWHPSELTTLMSASDDRTVRLWDLPSDSSTETFHGHEDYVRSGSFLPGQSERIMVTGSYDQTVRIWDPRVGGKSVMTFKHAAAIEAVLPLPSGTTVLAAAENQVSVLDLIAAKPIRLLKNHQKTVTSLCLASNGSRVLAGGLDGHVKVFETSGWNVAAGVKYLSPILSLNVIPSGANRDDKHLIVGMQSGLLSIRTKLSGQEKATAREREKEMQALVEGRIEEYDKKNKKKTGFGRGWEKRFRGKDYTGEAADIVIEGTSRLDKRRENVLWQRQLRQGKYSRALETVLSKVS